MAVRMPLNPCVSCGKPLDAATLPRDVTAMPTPGDISICFYCGHLMLFDDNLHLRNLTDAEMHDIAGHPDMVLMQKLRGKVTR